MSLHSLLGTQEKRTKYTTNVKVGALMSMIQGEPIKLTLKVLAGGDYGFPNTTDLEFFRAFEHILTERLLQQGELNNPIGVTGREILVPRVGARLVKAD